MSEASPVLVYSTPGCQGCKVTARQLDSLGVAYEMVDLAATPERASEFEGLGYSSAPIVRVPDEAAYGDLAGAHWSGVRPDQFTRLGALRAA